MQQSKLHSKSLMQLFEGGEPLRKKGVSLLYSFVSAISCLQCHLCKHVQVLIRQDTISAPQQKIVAGLTKLATIKVRKVAMLQIMAGSRCPAVDASGQEQQSVKPIQRAVTSELDYLL